MEYKILTYPHPLLLRKVKRVKNIGEDELKTVRIMINIMLKNNGIGLAANQIGIDKRVFVASPAMKIGEVLIVFNPRIIKMQGKSWAEEGCLSMPGITAKVKRASKIKLTGWDLEGKSIIIETEGILAQIIQHEVDHLNGKIFIKRLSLKERRNILKKLNSR